MYDEPATPTKYCHAAGCARSATSHLWDTKTCPAPAEGETPKAMQTASDDVEYGLHCTTNDGDSWVSARTGMSLVVAKAEAKDIREGLRGVEARVIRRRVIAEDWAYVSEEELADDV